MLLMVCLRPAPPIGTRFLIWQEKVNKVNDAIQSDQTQNNSILRKQSDTFIAIKTDIYFNLYFKVKFHNM